MRVDWKKQDRECPPCPNCGAERFEAFWGNGGWVPTDKKTGEMHTAEDCVRVLRDELVERDVLVQRLGSALHTLADGVLASASAEPHLVGMANEARRLIAPKAT